MSTTLSLDLNDLTRAEQVQVLRAVANALTVSKAPLKRRKKRGVVRGVVRIPQPRDNGLKGKKKGALGPRGPPVLSRIKAALARTPHRINPYELGERIGLDGMKVSNALTAAMSTKNKKHNSDLHREFVPRTARNGSRRASYVYWLKEEA